MKLLYSKTQNQLWCAVSRTGMFIPQCIKDDEIEEIEAREVYNCPLPICFDISLDNAVGLITNEKDELAVLIPYDNSSEAGAGATWYSRTYFKYDVIEIYEEVIDAYFQRAILLTHSAKGMWKVKELVGTQYAGFRPYCFTRTLACGNTKPEALLNSGLNMNTFKKKYPVYQCDRYTGDTITAVEDNEVFVFGSNPAGMHNGAAAKLAKDKFGAIQGQGEGLQGQSYAIPTTQGGLKELKKHVDKFIDFAIENPQLTFLVTRIGCGNAGLKVDDVAPLFRFALGQSNIVLPKEFVEVIA